MRFFGAGSSDEPKQTSAAPAASVSESRKPASGKTSLKDLEAFVDYVVKALVDNPQEVKIATESEGEGKVIKISCRKEDVGKIVGKKGKTIIALRSLVGGAASRLQEKVSVEVVD
jgi:predicted RNA-binding protein YlqC (UPF0109 family)